MSASGSARDRVRATPFDTALNAEAAANHKPIKLKATTFFGGDLPVPAARLDENKQLVTDRAFKPDTANAYIIDWASKVPYRQGGFRETGPSSSKSAALVGSLPLKNRAAVDFLVDERFAAAVAKDPQYLIDGSDALPELRKTLTDTCREEWPTIKDAVRIKFSALASGDRLRYNTELAAFKSANPSYVTPSQKRAKAASEQAVTEARTHARITAARKASNNLAISKQADPSYLAQSAGAKKVGASGEALRRSLRDAASKSGPADARRVSTAAAVPISAAAAVAATTAVPAVAAAVAAAAAAAAAAAGKSQGSKRKAPAALEQETVPATSRKSVSGKPSAVSSVAASKVQKPTPVVSTKKADKANSSAPDSSSAPKTGEKTGATSSKSSIGADEAGEGAATKEDGRKGQGKGNKRKLQAIQADEEQNVVAAIAPPTVSVPGPNVKASSVLKKTVKAAPASLRSQPSHTAVPSTTPAPTIPISPPSVPLTHAPSVPLLKPASTAPSTAAVAAVPSQVAAVSKKTSGRGSAAVAAEPKVKRVAGTRTAPPPAPAVAAVVVDVVEDEVVPDVKRRKAGARKSVL